MLVDQGALDRKIKGEVRAQVVPIETKLDEEFQKNKALNDLYYAIDVARNTAGSKDWGVLNPLYNKANEIFSKDPLNRKAAILTARFISDVQHDQMDPVGNEQAIRRLDEFLDAKRAAGQRDRDFADVLSNRAGHAARILASRSLPADNPDMVRRKTQALRDFQESVSLAPSNAKEATDDPDFASLHEDPEFKRIVAAAYASPTEKQS
jgi:hypothetical protein